ncbi:translocation protein TolB [Moraxella sp. ZJ142]|uniref:translocation protein TolB n=1 Tax=Moraxella marmotae TaxID=3344520 RepID=UPI0035D4C1D5
MSQINPIHPIRQMNKTQIQTKIKPLLTKSACVLFTSVLGMMAAHADGDDEVMVITRSVAGSAYPVAVMPFAQANKISDNLNLAGLGATHQNLPQHTQSASEILHNLSTWRNQGFGYVVIVRTHSMPSNKTAISYEIVDTNTAQISDKQTQVSDNHPAALAVAYNQISDKIYQAISHQPSDLTGKIAYVEETGTPNNKTSSLKLIDVHGQAIATLYTVNGSILTPTFSPDGSRIAYSVQTKDGLPVIHIQSVNGGQPQVVTPFWGHNLAPSFSPNGDSILFSGSHENNNPNIYRLNFTANRLERLTNLAGAENSPNYLPSGTGFIYTADHGTRSQSLQRYDFGTGKSTQIAARASNPRLSPDGNKLVYVASNRIVIANTQGKTQQSFAVNGTEISASFSPSSTRIVYAQKQGNQSQLMIRSLTSNTARTIATTGIAKDPVWSK